MFFGPKHLIGTLTLWVAQDHCLPSFVEEVQLLGRATFGMPHMLHDDEPRHGQQAVHVGRDT